MTDPTFERPSFSPTYRPLVVYHSHCRDGFGAAWVIRNALAKTGDEADFFAAQYGQPVPDVAGRAVIMVDFSYPRPVMEEIAASASTLLVLDHHRTAQAALDGFMEEMIAKGRPVVVVFDMDRSGIGLAWDHFRSGEPRPPIVDYVEDRDLWKFRHFDSKLVNAFLGTIKYDFNAWDEVSQLPVEHMVRFGQAVQGKIDHYLEAVSGNARRVVLDGHSVPCVNAPQVDISELVGELAELHAPGAPKVVSGEVEAAPFAVGWWQRGDGKFQYSLRSRSNEPDGGFDVSALAKKFGGGGHKNAAGFQLDRLLFADTSGVTYVGGTWIRDDKEQIALYEKDRSELEWWRAAFATRFNRGNLPRPGSALTGRRFVLCENIAGTRVATQFGEPSPGLSASVVLDPTT